MLSFILYIALALVLGMCIGLERQLRQRATGLRTNALVALGAAIFMAMACKIGGTAEARVLSYIISGIGFLGAGVIIKDGASVRGLNTAATLWCTAAIGAFCGLGYVYEPIIGTIFIIAIHLFMRPLSTRLMKTKVFVTTECEELHYKFVACCKESVENHIRVLFVQYLSNNNGLLLSSLSSRDAEVSGLAIIEADIISLSKQDATIEKIASFLTLENGVSSVKWESCDIESRS